jgi:ribosomal protein S18
MEARVYKTNGIGFRFDVFAWYFTTQRLSVDLDGIKDTDGETLFYTLLFAAHESYCRHSILKRNRYTIETFRRKIDTLQYGSIKELQKIISESVQNETQSETELKKKHQNGLS